MGKTYKKRPHNTGKHSLPLGHFFLKVGNRNYLMLYCKLVLVDVISFLFHVIFVLLRRVMLKR